MDLPDGKALCLYAMSLAFCERSETLFNPLNDGPAYYLICTVDLNNEAKKAVSVE